MCKRRPGRKSSKLTKSKNPISDANMTLRFMTKRLGMAGYEANLKSQMATPNSKTQPTTSMAIIDAGVSSVIVIYPITEAILTIVPTALRALRQGEGKENECDRSADEQKTHNVELLCSVIQTNGQRVLVLALDDEAEALRLALGPQERHDERRERDGDEDGEHAIW